MATFASIQQQRSSKFTGLAVGLILTTALIHLVLVPEDLSENTLRGVLFIFSGLAGVVAAFGIYFGAKWWGWTLGLLVAGGAFLFYVASRAFGIPWQDSLGEWLEPIGVLSLVVEVGFIALWVWAFSNPDDVLE